MKRNKLFLLVFIILILIFGILFYIQNSNNKNLLNINNGTGSININNGKLLNEQLKIIKNKKIILSDDNIDEINKMESFYSNNPRLMFYVLKYVETKDINYCDKIKNDKKTINGNIKFENEVTNYCKNIYLNGSLNENLINKFV